MAKNRSIEAKRVKYLKQSKARPRYLKPDYGHIKVSRSVGKSHIPEDAVSLFAYRDRVISARTRDPWVEEFVEALISSMWPDFSRPVPKPREHEHMRLAVNQFEPVERKLLVQNGKFIKVAMVSNRDLTCVQFLEYQRIPGLIRRSITYGSYDRAMQVFQLATIRWKEFIHVPNVETQSGVEYPPPD